MVIEEFKTYALRTMLEENLWKVGEEDAFTFMGVKYKIKCCIDYFELSIFNNCTKEWNKPRYFKKLTALFRDIFRCWEIRY